MNHRWVSFDFIFLESFLLKLVVQILMSRSTTSNTVKTLQPRNKPMLPPMSAKRRVQRKQQVDISIDKKLEYNIFLSKFWQHKAHKVSKKYKNEWTGGRCILFGYIFCWVPCLSSAVANQKLLRGNEKFSLVILTYQVMIWASTRSLNPWCSRVSNWNGNIVPRTRYHSLQL